MSQAAGAGRTRVTGVTEQVGPVRHTERVVGYDSDNRHARADDGASDSWFDTEPTLALVVCGPGGWSRWDVVGRATVVGVPQSLRQHTASGYEDPAWPSSIPALARRSPRLRPFGSIGRGPGCYARGNALLVALTAADPLVHARPLGRPPGRFWLSLVCEAAAYVVNISDRGRHLDVLFDSGAGTSDGYRAQALTLCIWNDSDLAERAANRVYLEERLIWAVIADSAGPG